MNNKGFTLVELLAVVIILSIILGIGIIAGNSIYDKAIDKSEEVFVKNLEDLVDAYVTDNGYKLFTSSNTNECTNSLVKYKIGSKKYTRELLVKYADVEFGNIVDNKQYDFKFENSSNPDQNNRKCNRNAIVTIYRDEDYVYYYSFNKSDLGCLTISGTVSTLPFELVNDGDGYTISDSLYECVKKD